jgi:hypothetical protein
MKDRESACKVPILSLKLFNIFPDLWVKVNGFPNGYFQILRSTPMASVSNNTDLNDCDLAHYCSLFTPQLSEIAYRPIMETINFAYSL